MKDRAETPVVVASEHEVGVSVQLRHENRFIQMPPGIIVAMLNAPLPEGVVGFNQDGQVTLDNSETRSRVYLSNGGCQYRDDYYYEINTGEHDSALELVANELDNEDIILHALQYLVEEGIIDGAIFSSKVLDHGGRSWGYHLNFLLERAFLDLARQTQIPKNPLAQHFALFLATWGMITGEGGVGRSLDGKSHEFYIHTKASTLTPGAEFGTQTTGPKTLFNTRDEPHADKKKYIRLHVISGDYTASPWAKRMSISMAAIVLKALVLGLKTDPKFEFQPGHLIDVAKTVATDPTCRKEVELADGRKIKPIEIQRAFLQMAQKVGQYRDLSEDDRWVLQEWERALDQLETDPMGLTVASWPHKFGLLNALQQREGGWSTEKVLAADQALARIGPGTTIDRRRRNVDRKGNPTEELWGAHMPPADRVKFQPSQRTRARLRAAFVRTFTDPSRRWLEPYVAWDHVTTYNPATRTPRKFNFPNPQDPRHEGLEAYLASL